MGKRDLEWRVSRRQNEKPNKSGTAPNVIEFSRGGEWRQIKINRGDTNEGIEEPSVVFLVFIGVSVHLAADVEALLGDDSIPQEGGDLQHPRFV